MGNVNAILTSFPADPSQQYQTQCQILLEGLNLPLLLQKEMERLSRWVTDLFFHLLSLSYNVDIFLILLCIISVTWSMPSNSTVVQKLLKTHKITILLHRMTYSFIMMNISSVSSRAESRTSGLIFCPLTYMRGAQCLEHFIWFTPVHHHHRFKHLLTPNKLICFYFVH